MSKVRKKNSEDKTVRTQEQSLDVPSVKETEVQTKEETHVPSGHQKLNLHDAATRFVVGFKEHHWPSIRKYADSLGVGEEATVDQCLEVFQGFGAKLK